MVAYATRSDLYRYGGVARGNLIGEGRLVASSTASTDLLELAGHNFETDDAVLVRATDGGTLSAPLVVGTTYYVIRFSDSTFKLSATASGAAIDLSSNGVSMVVTAQLPVDDMLELYSRWVDAFLPAHLVPLASPYPVVVTAIVAQLAGKALLNLDGKSSEVVNATELAAKAQLERWAKGIPLRDARATASSNKAVTSNLGATVDPRGWCPSGSGTLP